MDTPSAVSVLVNRVSCALLREPAPEGEQRELIQRAALRAADHRQLRPWRFLTVENEALLQLGEIFVQARLQDNPELSAEEEARTRGLPSRAPLVIVAIASCVEDPKVPEWEQLLSAGAAVQNMLNACYALGFGAIWRTGDLASHAVVRQGLGLTANESLVGFLYVGTPRVVPRAAPVLAVEDFFRPWPESS
ncbi:MAG: nitroreductase family protein [Porticoccaceae bacterium]|nr:nitroreductase family protein [Porticoccaceae bacterium]